MVPSGRLHILDMRPVLLLLAVAVVGCEASAPETASGPEAVADLESTPACSPSDFQDWLQWAPDDDGDPRPSLTMQCLPRELDRDADGLVNCVVIEVR